MIHGVMLSLRGRFTPSRVVASRVACLGKELFSEWGLINQQKSRADVFLKSLGHEIKPRYSEIMPFIRRKDILPLIAQQCGMPWDKIGIPGRLFIMDSFSELTDQEFVHKKEGWSFCANYSDIDHNAEFKETFDAKGLLPVSQFEKTYKDFFEWLFSKNSNITILYLHFPTALDERPQFRERARCLHSALQMWEGKGIVNVSITDNMVSHAGGDAFPYHYSDATYNEFRELLLRLGVV